LSLNRSDDVLGEQQFLEASAPFAQARAEAFEAAV